MNRQLGLVVFSNNSGIGNQSRRLTQMLRPEKLLLIDSTPFSKNKDQHPEWYDGFSGVITRGFPTFREIKHFLNGLTHVYLIENPLNWQLIAEAKRNGIKTYIASNYEFCDNLIHPHLPIPDLFLMPSYWMVEEMKQKFGEERVQYLPPPIDPNEFKRAREVNFNRRPEEKRRFLHIVGTLASEDRNGTLSLLKALQYTDADFQLVIKSQHQLPDEYRVEDSRVIYEIGDQREVEALYTDFDAMILPRRFGGLCLPMMEALCAGLPVIMTDISPNNKILPPTWLAPAVKTGSIMTRTSIDLYSADLHWLAGRIADFSMVDINKKKLDAFDIAYENYRPAALQEGYDKLWL